MLTRKRIHELSIGYDLDCGGYEWERVPRNLQAALRRAGVRGPFLYLDAGLDYLPGDFKGDPTAPHFQRHADFVLWQPGAERSAEWPKWLAGQHELLSSGLWFTTDHDCHCRGEPDEEEPGGWKFTGTSGEPHPECDRCGGEGSIESLGGAWAVYCTRG